MAAGRGLGTGLEVVAGGKRADKVKYRPWILKL